MPGSRLRLTRLGINAKITAVNTVGNVMQIPRDPHSLGWWRGGAAPGASAGTTVIVGHINYAGVTGALAVLPDARPGDAVVVDEGRTNASVPRDRDPQLSEDERDTCRCVQPLRESPARPHHVWRPF